MSSPHQKRHCPKDIFERIFKDEVPHVQAEVAAIVDSRHRCISDDSCRRYAHGEIPGRMETPNALWFDESGTGQYGAWPCDVDMYDLHQCGYSIHATGGVNYRRVSGPVEYRVRWKAYPDPVDDTWEPMHRLMNVLRAIRLYHEAQLRDDDVNWHMDGRVKVEYHQFMMGWCY